MAEQNVKKIKLLRLIEILRAETVRILLPNGAMECQEVLI